MFAAEATGSLSSTLDPTNLADEITVGEPEDRSADLEEDLQRDQNVQVGSGLGRAGLLEA